MCRRPMLSSTRSRRSGRSQAGYLGWRQCVRRASIFGSLAVLHIRRSDIVRIWKSAFCLRIDIGIVGSIAQPKSPKTLVFLRNPGVDNGEALWQRGHLSFLFKLQALRGDVRPLGVCIDWEKREYSALLPMPEAVDDDDDDDDASQACAADDGGGGAGGGGDSLRHLREALLHERPAHSAMDLASIEFELNRLMAAEIVFTDVLRAARLGSALCLTAPCSRTLSPAPAPPQACQPALN